MTTLPDVLRNAALGNTAGNRGRIPLPQGGGTFVQFAGGSLLREALRRPSCPRHYWHGIRLRQSYGATRCCTQARPPSHVMAMARLLLPVYPELAPLYVFAKRTHRFLPAKQHLSISDTMRYVRKFRQKTVGSFCETNPPVRLREGFGAIATGIRRVACRRTPLRRTRSGGFGGVEAGNWVVWSRFGRAGGRQ